jgi:hypothetical protein
MLPAFKVQRLAGQSVHMPLSPDVCGHTLLDGRVVGEVPDVTSSCV